MTTRKPQSFIVFTVDHEAQQTFIDFYAAFCADDALDFALNDREYACWGLALTPRELRQLADQCEAQS